MRALPSNIVTLSKAYPQLKTLDLSGCPVPPKDLVDIGQLKYLETVDLTSCGTQVGDARVMNKDVLIERAIWKALASLPKLTSLSVGAGQVSSDPSQGTFLDRWEARTLEKNVSDEIFNSLRSFKSLTHLKLGWSLHQKRIKILSSLTSLRHLDLTCCSAIDGARMGDLRKNKRILEMQSRGVSIVLNASMIRA